MDHAARYVSSNYIFCLDTILYRRVCSGHHSYHVIVGQMLAIYGCILTASAGLHAYITVLIGYTPSKPQHVWKEVSKVPEKHKYRSLLF